MPPTPPLVAPPGSAGSAGSAGAVQRPTGAALTTYASLSELGAARPTVPAGPAGADQPGGATEPAVPAGRAGTPKRRAGTARAALAAVAEQQPTSAAVTAYADDARRAGARGGPVATAGSAGSTGAD